MNITPISRWFMVRKQRTSYWGESKPTNITGGPHIVWKANGETRRKMIYNWWVFHINLRVFSGFLLGRNPLDGAWCFLVNPFGIGIRDTPAGSAMRSIGRSNNCLDKYNASDTAISIINTSNRMMILHKLLMNGMFAICDRHHFG